MSNANDLISIIIPALNEEASLRLVVTGLIDQLAPRENYRIVIVNDGSTDSTGRIADALEREHAPRIQVIHHPGRRGLGGAYKSALERIEDGYVTWIPADGEIHPSSVAEAISHRAPGRVVVTYPDQTAARGISRRILSRAFQRALNLLFQNRIRYFNGNSLYPVEYARAVRVQASGFFFNAELLLRVLHRFRPSYREIAFRLVPRRGGRSKAVTLQNAIQLLQALIRLRWDLL